MVAAIPDDGERCGRENGRPPAAACGGRACRLCVTIDAPWVVDGPINGELFRLYVEKVLVPTPKRGDIVILDNLGSHKSKAVRAALRAAGARLFFLPP